MKKKYGNPNYSSQYYVMITNDYKSKEKVDYIFLR